MKNQSSKNKLVITEEFIFDQNKLSKDPNYHFNSLLTSKAYLLVTYASSFDPDQDPRKKVDFEKSQPTSCMKKYQA